jgi:hypothetical protein
VRNWKVLVRERLGSLNITPAQQEEVVAELSAHLEDLYEEGRAQGLGESEAVERALDEVADWGSLSQKIRRAKQEDNMNQRTRTLWLPGLVSLTSAMAFLMILQASGVQPHFIWMRSGPPLELYTPWLVAHPLFGAMGAYLSRRAGGDRRACLAAGLFPSITMLALCCVGVSVKLITDRAALQIPLFAILAQLGVWIVLPGLALLIGALPFLNASKLRVS